MDNSISYVRHAANMHYFTDRSGEFWPYSAHRSRAPEWERARIPLTGHLEDGIFVRMKTIVSTKGEILLPAEFRRRDHIEPGQEFEVERLESGKYRLTRTSRRRNEGLLQLLRSCPVKGWFCPANRSEKTEELKPPRPG